MRQAGWSTLGLDVAERVEALAQRLGDVAAAVHERRAEHDRLARLSAEQRAAALQQKFPRPGLPERMSSVTPRKA